LAGMYGAANGMAQLQITTMRDVTPSRVEWLWEKRVPRGKLTVLAGDPGVGKSYAVLSFAGTLSVGGVWPDGNAAPLSNVLIVSAEDGLADTIRPRLDLLKADLGRIHHINTVLREGEKEVGLSLSDHLFQIEEAIIEYRADLVILDPILAFMGKKADTHKSSDVRAVLAPIGSVAERTGCAFLAVLHLNKRSTEGSSIYRLMASLDFAAAARAVFIVGKNPDDPDQRVFAAVKIPVVCLLPRLADFLSTLAMTPCYASRRRRVGRQIPSHRATTRLRAAPPVMAAGQFMTSAATARGNAPR